MIEPVKVGDRLVGEGHPCFVIAEAGVNHNGDMQLAHRLIEAAALSGADAVKFQSFITEELVTPAAQKAPYQVQTTGQRGGQYQMLKALELSTSQQAELASRCRECGILFLSTPYDWHSVDILDDMDVAAFKIASTDVTNVPFLRYVGHKGRPVILSTGMSTLGEVEEAVNTLRQTGLDQIVLLQCTSAYPAPPDQVNLRAMETLSQAFKLPVGFSDHTPGLGAAPWAAALGACMIEKHFTLERTLPGPDHKASLEPDELTELVHVIRQIEAALGDGIKQPAPSELPNKPLLQKSLVARRDIAKGATVTEADLTCRRPATGLPPGLWDKVVGQKAARAIGQGEVLTFECIDWKEPV